MPLVEYGPRLIPGEIIDALLQQSGVGIGPGTGYSAAVSAGGILTWPYLLNRVSITNATDVQTLSPLGGTMNEGQQVRLWWPNGGSFFGSLIVAGGNITLEIYNGQFMVVGHS